MDQKYHVNDLVLTRGDKKNKFIEKKDNVVNSLKEVENFLWNWKKICKGIRLYKILR